MVFMASLYHFVTCPGTAGQGSAWLLCCLPTSLAAGHHFPAPRLTYSLAAGQAAAKQVVWLAVFSAIYFLG